MKFTILGCGSSMGVPRPDGNFGNTTNRNRLEDETSIVSDSDGFEDGDGGV